MKNFGDEHLAEEMRNGAMGTNPRLALAMSKAIQAFNDATSEDTFTRVKMDVNSLSGKAGAEAERDRIMADPATRQALLDANDPGHTGVLERWRKVTNLLAG